MEVGARDRHNSTTNAEGLKDHDEGSAKLEAMLDARTAVTASGSQDMTTRDWHPNPVVGQGSQEDKS